MGRKNVHSSFKPFDAVNIATNQISPVTDIQQTDNISYIVSWAGASPVGELVIEVADEIDPVQQPNWTWVALGFGAPISISGNTGSHDISINQCPFSKIRIRYIATSGTGNLTAVMTTKQVGG